LPLEAIEPRRLYRQIADQLRQLIDHGEYPVGSRLPTERELAEIFGVSRPTVREALIALEVEGLLKIRVGSGIYVNARQPSEACPVPTPIEGPFEVLRARAFVESAVAEEAARRAKPTDIARLDAILAEVGGPTLSVEHWVALDRSFHRAVVATLGNVVLLRTVGELFDQRINPYFAQLARHIENDSTWRAAHVEHVAIRDAIAAHRPADAKAAMREHLERSHRRFSRDFGEAPFVHRNGEAKDAPLPAVLQRGKGTNPLKTRKEPHKVAAC
jgi:DNA-binding FadR family transcriptional regulator